MNRFVWLKGDATLRTAASAAPFAFDPDQPRVPAGSPEGGEWASGTGGGPTVPPVPPTALARYYHSTLGYIADNGPATAGELAEHLGDRHRLGAAKARAVVDHLASTGDLVRAKDEYGRDVLGPRGAAVAAPTPAPPVTTAPDGALPGAVADSALRHGLPEGDEPLLSDFWDSRAFKPDSAAYGGDWLETTAKHQKFKGQLSTAVYGANHVSVGPDSPDVRLLLQESLGRPLHAYREGWQLAVEEAHWLGLPTRPGAISRPPLTVRQAATEARRRAAAPAPAAASREAHVLDFAARAGKHPGGLAPVWELGRQLGLSPDDLKALLFRLDREDKIRLVAVGDRGRLTREQLRDSVQGENETFAYIGPGPAHPTAPFAFDPDQPRVPAGSPGGGEWSAGGGGAATAEKPPPRKPRVDVGLTDKEEAAVAKIIKSSLKIKAGLTGEQLAALGGAPDDAQVEVRPGKDKKSLTITMRDGFSATRHLKRLGSGELVMENESIEVKAKGRGLGTEIFARQVDAARALGVGSIRCHAARKNDRGDDAFNGYSTWPRLGYDQDFEDLESQGPAGAGLAARARAAFPGAESVLEVMTTPEGRAWWKENGTDLFKAKFDLTEGSNSMKVFNAYREEKTRG